MLRSRFIFVGCIALLVSGVCLTPEAVSAYNPHVISTPLQNDVLPLQRPKVSQTILGTLEGYPHMFEFATARPMELFAEISVPDIAGARTNVSGIILRVNDDGSVTEVTRLQAKEASWESFYEPIGGDSYLRGSSFRKSIEPGLYRLEVSTPDNIGKYVLAVGTEDTARIGYGEMIRQLIEVKKFFGKSSFRVVESLYVYGPVGAIAFLAGGVWWYARRRRALSV